MAENNNTQPQNNQYRKRRHGGPMGGGGVMSGGEKAKNFKGTIGKIIKYMGRYKIAVFTVMIFALG